MKASTKKNLCYMAFLVSSGASLYCGTQSDAFDSGFKISLDFDPKFDIPALALILIAVAFLYKAKSYSKLQEQEEANANASATSTTPHNNN